MAKRVIVFVILVTLASLADAALLSESNTGEDGFAFIAHNPKGALNFLGHVCCGFALDNGSIMVCSFGPLDQPGILRTLPIPGYSDTGAVRCPGDLTYVYKSNMNEVNDYLSERGYTTKKVFVVENPKPAIAENWAISHQDVYYEWDQASWVREKSTENCISFAKKILETYGVTGLPAIDYWKTQTPDSYYDSIPGAPVLIESSGKNSGSKPISEGSSGSVAAVDALLVGFPEESQATPQVTLSLYVHDEGASGPIIQDAHVTGQDGSGNSFEQTTDSDGYVTITGYPGYPGTWHYSVSADGYETRSWSQAISETDTKDAYLQKEASTMTSVVYGTAAKENWFDFDEWGTYKSIDFLGVEYFAEYVDCGLSYLYDASTDKSLLDDDQLSMILLNDDERYTITSASPTMKLKEGYELIIEEIDVNDNAVYLQLMRDGVVVDTDLIEPSKDGATIEDKTYIYKTDLGDTKDIVIIAVHFVNAVRDSDTYLAYIDGVWQISETPMELKS